MKVLYPDSILLNLPSRDENLDFVKYSVTQDNFNGLENAEMLVMWNNSEVNSNAAEKQLKNLKLVQTLAAGPDHLLGIGFNKNIKLASGKGLHDKTVTEHVLALLLHSIRNFGELSKSQNNHYWNQNFVNAQSNEPSNNLYTLNGNSILIIGFGSIAKNLVPILRALGANVTGVGKTSGVIDDTRIINHSEMMEELHRYLVVISLLPYTKDTNKYFDDKFFSKMDKKSIFINCGRGKTLDENALYNALTKQTIRMAAIDVTYTEPLSRESTLWDLKNLFITPHVAGGRPLNAEDLILFNARALLNNSPIKNLIS